VYQQLQAEGCAANMVTYNILIDAYARTGQWARAAEVLGPIAAAGLTPEARTYNAVIAACGKAGQPSAAVGVYERMLADGVEPTGTTYTSVISAFGRTGQVEEALRVYRDMAARGCERNVITYSSLISVCERAGRADVALRLLDEMRAAGVRPNVVTYNALIGACAAAGLWQRAAGLAEDMAAGGCRPDAVTYSSLIAAFERGGEWRQALVAFEKMQAAGFRPDACAYNSVLGALWSSGRVPAMRKAAQLLGAAQRQGALRLQALSPADATATAYTLGAAVLVALKWLCNFRDGLAASAFASTAGGKTLLLARGKHARADHSYEPLRAALAAMFAAFGVPAAAEVTPQGLLLKTDVRLLPTWAGYPSGAALLSLLDSVAGLPAAPAAALVKEDRAAEAQCGKAFAAVREFEAAHAPRGDADAGSPTAAAVRQDVIACITALAGGLALREEAPHDAVQLLDRLLACTPATQLPPPPAAAAALLALAARQSPGGAAAALRAGQVVLSAAGLPLSAVAEAEARVLGALGGDPAAISPLRVLQLFLERLGCDGPAMQRCQALHMMGLTAVDGVAKAAISPAFVSFPPSVVAAACLLRARQSLGLAPAWPDALRGMTGYAAEGGDLLAQCSDMMAATGILG
jgi:pentatricopeptide repeat domain-containing protein 1